MGLQNLTTVMNAKVNVMFLDDNVIFSVTKAVRF